MGAKKSKNQIPAKNEIKDEMKNQHHEKDKEEPFTLCDILDGLVDSKQFIFPPFSELGWSKTCFEHQMGCMLRLSRQMKCISMDASYVKHLGEVIRPLYEKGFAMFRVKLNYYDQTYYYAFVDIVLWHDAYIATTVFNDYVFRNEDDFNGYRFDLIYWYPRHTPDPVKSYAEKYVSEQFPSWLNVQVQVQVQEGESEEHGSRNKHKRRKR